jgi:hypothetical protein
VGIPRAQLDRVPPAMAWLRDGAKLLLPNNMLPRRQARGDVIAANTDIRRGHLAHNVFRTHPSVG